MLHLVLPLIIAVVGFATTYLAHKKADNSEAMALMKSTAYDTMAKLLNNVLIAGKDAKITEQEWQAIADDAIKELNKLP